MRASNWLKRPSLVAAATLLIGFSANAHHETVEHEALVATDDRPYMSFMGTFVGPDEERDAKYGGGAHVSLGLPVNANWVFEIFGFGDVTERSGFGIHDFQYGFGLDMLLRGDVYFLGKHRFTPFFLIGGGGTIEDIKDERYFNGYANVGLGSLFPITDHGVAVRFDVRTAFVFADEDEYFANGATSSREDVLVDLRANIGIQIPLSAPALPEIEKEEDFDNDGVTNDVDECPNTPEGVLVARTGCELDDDNDNVPNAIDNCPNTPEGTEINHHGCALVEPKPEPAPEPEPVVVIAPEPEPEPEVIVVIEEAEPEPEPVGRVYTDDDADGVIDDFDRCPDTLIGLEVDDFGCAIKAQAVVLENVNFEFNSARLTANAKTVLAEVAEAMKGQSTMTVELAGHTDSIGSAAYNLRLSEQRAQAVRLHLISQGVNPGQMIARGYGESKPVADNKAEAGRELNRRVEFTVLNQ